MARVIRKRWASDLSAPSRRDAKGCEYEAYLPDFLTGRTITLDGDVAADVADAEAALAKLSVEAVALVDTEALARMLVRAESVASSKIEGLEVGPRRLLRAEAARDLGDDPNDVPATEVLGNIDAMVYGIKAVGPGDPITVKLILQIHERLLAGSRIEEHGGRFRVTQNWIGGSDYDPCRASFVPPPPEKVDELMHDLVAFSNESGLPAVAQAAIAHAQFETIHPFVDGNGRAGRALIHLILRRRGAVARINPPVSLILATRTSDYIGGLMGTRYRGSATSAEARNGINGWVGRFAGACSRSVEEAKSFEQRALAIETEWRERLGKVRAKSATDLLLRQLVGTPVLTVKSTSALIERSTVQTNLAVNRLVDVGVLTQVTVGRRNRGFEAPQIVNAFADLERQLTSPSPPTSEPTRPVRRRKIRT